MALNSKNNNNYTYIRTILFFIVLLLFSLLCSSYSLDSDYISFGSSSSDGEIIITGSGDNPSGNTYNCNVDSTIPSNCTNFVQDPNIKTHAMVNCTYISDCIKVVQNMSLTMNDILNINLADSLYDGEENCNLFFDTAAQIIISPTNNAVTIDCINQPSFITHVRANLVMFNVMIKNAYESCIAIQQNPTSFTIYVYNSVFKNCSSSSNGGAIQASYPNAIIIYDSAFIGNQAYQGGSISAYTAHIFNSMFLRNSAIKGGAIFTDSTMPSSYIYTENCTFTSNNAHLGGAVYAYDLKTSLNTIFSNNFAQVGGAVFAQSIYSQSTRFLVNSAVNGGAIALFGSQTKNQITLSFLYNNTAEEDGGALYIYSPAPSTSLNLERSKLFNNQASGFGGAVYFNQTDTSYLLGGVFSDNYSSDNEEIACDDSSQPYNCNPCIADQCGDCLQMNGAICITQNFKSYCYVAEQSCIFGSCYVGNSSATITCNCSTGYEGDSCDSPIPTPSPSPTPHPHGNNQALKLEIAMPIVFGSLVILFLVVIFIMIKKRNSDNSYQPLINSD